MPSTRLLPTPTFLEFDDSRSLFCLCNMNLRLNSLVNFQNY